MQTFSIQKTLHFVFVTVLVVALNTISMPSLAETDLSARDIMQRMDDNQRKTTASAFTRMKLTTCKFGYKDSKIKCVEKPRIKVIESVQINTGVDNKDTRAIAIIIEPASERGIGMLSYSYDNPDRENETWIYLSALRKVMRISVNRRDDEGEPANLFGTEISTEDRESGNIDDYTYTLLERGEYRGRPVAIIESVPKPHQVQKSSYGKTRTWVDTERFIALKIQMFDKNDNPIKRVDVGKIEKINGVWLGRSLTFINSVSQRLTNMKLEAINFDIVIDPSFLTQRTLTDQAFRERYLNILREQAQ